MPVIRDWLDRAARLPRATQIATGAGVLAVAVAISWLAIGPRGCTARSDVEARVAFTSAALQQVAAQGKLKIADLAIGIRRLNEGATDYNTTQDHQAYCAALDKLGDEFKLDN